MYDDKREYKKVNERLKESYKILNCTPFPFYKCHKNVSQEKEKEKQCFEGNKYSIILKMLRMEYCLNNVKLKGNYYLVYVIKINYEK